MNFPLKVNPVLSYLTFVYADMAGLYYISIYGFEDDSYHTVTASTYTDTYISSASVTLGSLEPGRYAYYRFHVDSTSGFQVRVSASDGTQGSLTATLKKDDYPLTDQDPSSVFGQALMQTKCQDCIIDHPPTLWARGDWYLAVLCHVYPVNFRVALLEFSETPLEFGSQSNRLSLSSLTWGYYTFTIEPDMEPEGFKLDVIPTDASYNLTTVLKKAQHPITLTDSTFKSQPCTHCRITVMTRQKLQATWYIGIYAGATGGEFELKIKLMEACPNNCFGNGVCVQRKIKVCRCFPGYTGLDCREAIKEKVFAWYPMDGHAADATDNKRPLFYKVNRDGKLQYENDGLTLLDTYVIIPKPTPDVACSQFTRMDEPDAFRPVGAFFNPTAEDFHPHAPDFVGRRRHCLLMDSLQCQHGDEATFIRLSGNQYRGMVPGGHSQFTGFEIEIAVCGGVFTVVALQTVDDQERSDVLFEINLPGGNGSGPGRQIVFAGLRLNDNEDGNDGEDRDQSDGATEDRFHERGRG